MSCDDCFKTVPHTSTPRGRTETIAGVETYLSEHPEAAAGRQKKLLLFFSGGFSSFYTNNQLIQDWFASNSKPHVSLPPPSRGWLEQQHGFAERIRQGYDVLGLDYFFGDRFEALMTQPGFAREACVAKITAQ